MTTHTTVVTEPKYDYEHRLFVRCIGTFHQRAAKTYSVPQEYAGARLDVEVPAGDYAIEICQSNGRVWLRTVLEGQQVHYSWHASHCHTTDNERKPYTYHQQQYCYMVAAMAERGEVTLLDARYSVVNRPTREGRIMPFLAFAGSNHPEGLVLLPGYASEIGFNPFDDVTV